MLKKILTFALFALCASHSIAQRENCSDVTSEGDVYDVRFNGILVDIVTNGTGWIMALDVNRNQPSSQVYVYKSRLAMFEGNRVSLYNYDQSRWDFYQQDCKSKLEVVQQPPQQPTSLANLPNKCFMRDRFRPYIYYVFEKASASEAYFDVKWVGGGGDGLKYQLFGKLGTDKFLLKNDAFQMSMEIEKSGNETFITLKGGSQFERQQCLPELDTKGLRPANEGEGG